MATTVCTARSDNVSVAGTAKFRCARCNLFYCSRECQVDDWTRHQLKCKAVPDLIGDFEASPVLSAKNFIGAEVPVTRRNRLIDFIDFIAFAELQNNNEVCISAYSSERIMYLRGLDTASLERTHRLIQRVAKWAQTAPALTEPPVCGQLVVAKFLLDGNFYCAIVTKIQDDKNAVSYVDYGNSEITTLENLRVLSDELKATSRPTKEAHQYLDLLVGKEQPLICTFEGNPGVDGVVLKTATGECINEQVNHFLTPVWEREDPSKNLKCFVTDDLDVASLGEIGHTVTAIPLFEMEPPFKYGFAPYNQEALTHITGIMSEQMLKYCESVEHYIPRTGELCLAIWEGGWYRGSCLNRSKTPTQAVIYFVDYGNIEVVDHTNIRQMTQDFMSPPAFVVSCEIKNLGIEPVNGNVPENIQKRVCL